MSIEVPKCYGIINKVTGDLIRLGSEECYDDYGGSYLQDKYLEAKDAPDHLVFMCTEKLYVEELVSGFRNLCYHHRKSVHMAPETHEVVEIQITYKRIGG